MSAPRDSLRQPPHGFRHHALLYRDDRDYAAALRQFEETVAGPLLIAVPEYWLRLALEQLTTRESVAVVDACDTLANPRCLVPMVTEFIAAHEGAPAGVLAQTDWSRSPEEADEAAIADSLANLAFEGTDLHLACPVRFARDAPEPAALGTHPVLFCDGELTTSSRYEDPLAFCDPARWPLSEPVVSPAKEFQLDGGGLQVVRHVVEEEALSAGLPERASADLVLSVNELATNSLTYASDQCRLRMWREPGELVTEVSDSGHIKNPLADQQRSVTELSEDSTGLWLVNQLCDLVRIRSSASLGTVVRLHMHLPDNDAGG